jgi:hypothetical protein
MTKECKQCFDRFTTYSDRDYCNDCTEFLNESVNRQIAERIREEQERDRQQALQRRERFSNARNGNCTI